MATMCVGATGLKFTWLFRVRFCRQELRLHSALWAAAWIFSDQLVGHFRHARENIFRLGHEIKSAQRERFERDRQLRPCCGADHDHRQPTAAHDLFQRIDAVQSRHFQIECHHLRLKFLYFLEGEITVHGGAHHLDRMIAFENLGISLRISAESSTTNTRTDLFIGLFTVMSGS